MDGAYHLMDRVHIRLIGLLLIPLSGYHSMFTLPEAGAYARPIVIGTNKNRRNIVHNIHRPVTCNAYENDIRSGRRIRRSLPLQIYLTHFTHCSRAHVT